MVRYDQLHRSRIPIGPVPALQEPETNKRFLLASKWVFWRLYDDDPQGPSAIYTTLIALLSLTVLFAPFTALLYSQGAFRVTQSVGNATVIRFTLLYAWNAIDAIPAIKITDTFNWQAPIIFLDPLGRIILIFYRALVLAPVIQLAVELISKKQRLDITIKT
jgi:hypothetical protein